MTFQPGLLDTGLPTRVLATTKPDIKGAVNIWTTLDANRRANQDARDRHKLSELTFDQEEKKAARKSKFNTIMQASLNPDGRINGEKAIAGLNQAGLFEEAQSIQDRMFKAFERKSELEKQKTLEMGKMADAVLGSDDPLAAFITAREDAAKRGLPLSRGLMNYNPSDEDIETGNLNPKIATELKYLSDKVVTPKGPMSIEDKLLLMRERYNAKKELAQTKSDIKVDQPLTEAEKSRERIAQRKAQIAESKEERDVEAFEQKKKEFARKNRAFKQKNQGQIDSIMDYLDLAKSIKANENMKFVTGIGKLARFVPGTGAADLNADIDRLGSSGVIEVMTKLKAESPTGSTGFGALSEKELAVLTNAFSVIQNPDITPAKKRKELDRVIKIMEKRLKEQRSLDRESNSLIGDEPEVGSETDIRSRMKIRK